MPRPFANHELAGLIRETGWSHAMFARHVVACGGEVYGLRLGYDYRAVGRWLRGAVPDPPTPELIAAVLSRVLRRTITVHQLGFHSGDTLSRSLALPASPADSVATVTELWRAAVDRRTFLTSTSFLTGLALESAVDWRTAPARAETLARAGAHGAAHDATQQVTGREVEALWDAYDEFGTLDHAHGGGHALTWLHDYLNTDVAPLLRGRYTTAIGADLYRAAAALTDMAGWMAMDASHHGLAQRLYTQAAGLAKHAGDPAFGAYIYGNLATQALLLGHTRTAVRLARTARDGAGRTVPASLSASIAITEARAHALLGDAHETRRNLAAADQAMSRANPDRDPAWLSPWTPAHHAGGAMHALRDLGQPREAAKRAPDALNAPATHSRTRALHTVLHASVLAAAGDLDAAAATARQAADLARPLKSRRLHQRLRELDGWLKPHATVPAIADAREHLHTARAVTEAG